MRTIIDGVLVHDFDKTIIAIKEIIARKRRLGEITADRARDAFTDIETLDYDDLECQISYLLCNPDLFGIEYWNVIRGCVLGRAVGKARLFRDALRDWVRVTRERNGCLYGEPLQTGA
ncbi:hypothetical protein B0G80_4421 [Paraburkholderia sp. BL6669N2]|uniref:hypothetical protein n=1 Tax=Paraburkholderia sp. BL6669N2 TaxID=1938807 RepID=UPI000E241A79|nr:hypothetical protein [Paraburkholderia sp. BL6669N2]REG61568.1 hypothetical protein B0G80_4421 [Paraburkholderia sp. BL6669N2]